MEALRTRPSPRRLRILCLGDSYTVGEGVAAADSWPHLLTAHLIAGGAGVTLRVIARTGWSIDELVAGIDDATPAPPYDLVTVQIGVNDQYRGGSAAVYSDALETLLPDAITLAGGRRTGVVMLSIPDWSVTPHGADFDRAAVGEQIDAFNAAARRVCAVHGVTWLDVTAATRTAPTEIAGDGLHPSAAMYRRWLADLIPVAERLLST